jgi:hypothetical protein
MLFSGSVRKVRTARQSSPCSVRRRAESAAHRTRQSDLPDRLRRADASPATRHTEVAPAPAGEWKTSRQFPARHEDEIESTFLGSSYFPCENWRFGPKTPYWPRTCKIVRCANTQSRKALMQAALRVITATFRTDSTITPGHTHREQHVGIGGEAAARHQQRCQDAARHETRAHAPSTRC